MDGVEKSFCLEAPKVEFGVGAGSGDDLIEGVDDDAADGAEVRQLLPETP